MKKTIFFLPGVERRDRMACGIAAECRAGLAGTCKLDRGGYILQVRRGAGSWPAGYTLPSPPLSFFNDSFARTSI
jgi:hypothetical protein